MVLIALESLFASSSAGNHSTLFILDRQIRTSKRQLCISRVQPSRSLDVFFPFLNLLDAFPCGKVYFNALPTGNCCECCLAFLDFWQ
jgi:hypothetical protein